MSAKYLKILTTKWTNYTVRQLDKSKEKKEMNPGNHNATHYTNFKFSKLVEKVNNLLFTEKIGQ